MFELTTSEGVFQSTSACSVRRDGDVVDCGSLLVVIQYVTVAVGCADEQAYGDNNAGSGHPHARRQWTAES